MWKRGCASSKRIMQQNLENSSLNWHHKNLNNGIKTDSNMSQNSDCHTCVIYRKETSSFRGCRADKWTADSALESQ